MTSASSRRRFGTMERGMALEADAADIQLTVHAIGDEANGYLMDMLERIIEKNGDTLERVVHPGTRIGWAAVWWQAA